MNTSKEQQWLLDNVKEWEDGWTFLVAGSFLTNSVRDVTLKNGYYFTNELSEDVSKDSLLTQLEYDRYRKPQAGDTVFACIGRDCERQVSKRGGVCSNECYANRIMEQHEPRGEITLTGGTINADKIKPLPKYDAVNNPKHYDLFADGTQSMDVIEASLTPEEFTGFLKGNCLKYRLRAGKKDKLEQDINKANWYENKLREVIENG